MPLSFACRQEPRALPLRQGDRLDRPGHLDAAGAGPCAAGPVLGARVNVHG